MALDAAALALCAKELSAALADARIDKIFEPTRDEVVLNLRTRTDNPHLPVPFGPQRLGPRVPDKRDV